MAETLRAELQLSIDQFTQSLQTAQQRVQQFAQAVSSQLQSATASLTANTTATQQNATANQALTSAMQRLQQTAQGQLSTLQQISTQLSQHAQAAQQATQSTTAWGSAWTIVAGLGIATTLAGIISGLKQIVTESVQVAMKMQNLEATFKGLTGSAGAARADLDFLRRTAATTGTDFLTLAQAFRNFEAATRGTALEGQKARDVFESIAGASRVMGATSAETGRALLALEQMVSKGRVSMEELRRQLGNALPGAMQIAARAMGVTSEELNKMVKEGLDAADFVEKFGRQVRQEFGPGLKEAANTAQATFARLGNEVQAFGSEIGRGILSVLKPLADYAEKTLRAIREEREKLERGIPGPKETPFGAGVTSPEIDRRQKEIGALQDQLRKLEDLKSAMKGSFFEWLGGEQSEGKITKVREQLAALIREQDAAVASLKKGVFFEQGLAGATGATPMTKAADDVKKAWEEAVKEQEKLTASLQTRQVPALDAARERAQAFEKSLEGIVEKAQQGSTKMGAWDKDTKQLVQEAVAYGKALDQQVQKLEDADDARKDAAREEERALKKNVQDRLQQMQERVRLEQDIAIDITDITQHEFAARRQELEQFLAKAREVGVDETLLAQVEAAKRMQIAQDEGQAIIAEHDKVVAAWREEVAHQRQIEETITRVTAQGTQSRLDDLRAFLARQRAMLEEEGADEAQMERFESAAKTRLFREETEEAQHEAKKQEQAWRQLAESIQSSLSSAFEQILDGTFDLFDTLKHAFFKLLADMAAYALTNQIIIPVLMQAFGGSGVGGAGGGTGGGWASVLGGATGVAGTETQVGENAAGGSGAWGTVMTAAQLGTMGYQVGTGQTVAGALLNRYGDITLGQLGIGSTNVASGSFAQLTPAAQDYFLGLQSAIPGYEGAGAVAGDLGAGAAADVTSGGEAGLAESIGSTTIGQSLANAGYGAVGGIAGSYVNQGIWGKDAGANVRYGGMAGGIVGGAIGTAILPGLGTMAGAFLGEILGGTIGSLFHGHEPEPLFEPRDVQAGRVGYDPFFGLQATQGFRIGSANIRDVGEFAPWQTTFEQINAGLSDMANQVVSKFQNISPQLQEVLVNPLNDAFQHIADQISGLSIAGDDMEEFAKNLQNMMGTTLPGFFNDAIGNVIKQLEDAVKKIDPVIKGFTDVIDILQKDLDALHQQQVALDQSLEASKTALGLTFAGPSDHYAAAQGQYQQLLAQFQTGTPQQRILLAPRIAQAAQQLMGMAQQQPQFQSLDMAGAAQAFGGALQSIRTGTLTPAQTYMDLQAQYRDLKTQWGASTTSQRLALAPQMSQLFGNLFATAKSPEVLGQDPGLVRQLQQGLLIELTGMRDALQRDVLATNTANQASLQLVQADLMQDIASLQTGVDDAFRQLRAPLEAQIAIATQQIDVLKGSLMDLGSIDATVQGSLAVLQQQRDLLGTNTGINDPLAQAQLVALGGVQTIGQQQLQVLQDISAKLGNVEHFQEGTSYVPRNAFAFLHRGERVVPAAQNSQLAVTIHATGETTANAGLAKQIAEQAVALIERRGRMGTTSIVMRK